MNKREHNSSNLCECCGQSTWEHKHTLTQGLAVALLTFNSKLGGFGSIAEVLPHNGICNFQKLKHWVLVQKVEGQGSGIWQITPTGDDFINGRLKLPKHVWTFNDQTVEFEGDIVTCRDCLKDDVYWKRYDDYVKEMR